MRLDRPKHSMTMSRKHMGELLEIVLMSMIYWILFARTYLFADSF